MSKRIITISREFGSGGRTIGKEVAQKLGYSYYDKELVRQVAVETGFDEKYIEQAGEYAPSKNWLSFGFAARGPREPWRECPPMIFFGPFSAGSFGALRKKSPASSWAGVPIISCGNRRIVSTYSFTPLWRPGRTVSCACTAPARRAQKNAWRRRTRGAASTTSTIPTGIGACLRTTTSLWTAESSASSGAWTSSPSWQRHCKKLRRILIFPLTNLQNLIECFLQTE